MKEIWKDIKGYEELYQCSDFGRIKRFYKDHRSAGFKILKPQKGSKYGHQIIHLSKNGEVKAYSLHRIILKTFIGPCPAGMECRHLDGNPTNNKLENLKWGTKLDNIKDSIKHKTAIWLNQIGPNNHNSKLKNKEIIEIFKLAQEGKLLQREIAIKFNTHQGHVSSIKLGKTQSHITGKIYGK